MKTVVVPFVLAVSIAACGAVRPNARALAAQDPAAAAAGTAYTNPLISSDFPDPAVLKADGAVYAYATQDTRPGGGFDNIGCARTTTMKKWERLADALPTKPAWASKTQNFWAPHVFPLGKRYLMYFAAQVDNPPGQDGFRMGLGVASADSPAGPFVPEAQPIELEDGFAAIDPFVMIDPATAKPVLVWGSGFKPLRARPLTADGLKFAPGTRVTTLLEPHDAPYEHLIEGPWIRQRDGWFYLFYSGDDCCTDVPGVGAPTYAVMVARAKSLLGPYERLKGDDGNTLPILHGNKRWLAPGHNAVLTDAHGKDWIFYHAIDALQRTTPGTKDLRRGLLMDPIAYKDGWPRIADDAPSTEALLGPAVF